MTAKEEILRDFHPEDNEINKKLRNLYAEIPGEFSRYVNDYNSHNDRKITNPYLICVPDAYVNSKTKIMVVGQETFGWFNEGSPNCDNDQYSDQNTVEELQSFYNWFVNRLKGTKPHGYHSQLWAFYRKLSEKVAANGMEIISNNIAKVGYSGGHTGYVAEAVDFLKPIFRKELKICTPDIIYFMTGPEYDELIKTTLGDYGYEDELNIGVRKFAKLNFNSDEYKNMAMYRTYHPSYLQRKNREPWCERVYEKLFSPKGCLCVRHCPQILLLSQNI